MARKSKGFVKAVVDTAVTSFDVVTDVVEHLGGAAAEYSEALHLHAANTKVKAQANFVADALAKWDEVNPGVKFDPQQTGFASEVEWYIKRNECVSKALSRN